MLSDILVVYIRKFLKRHKMTQADFARLIKCPEATVNRWLNDRNSISLAWGRIIEDILKEYEQQNKKKQT